MNGPDHYREAEKLLALADSQPSENWSASTGEHKADIIASAQVHATLALAAIHAHHTGPGVDGPDRVANDWAWDGIL